MPRKPAAQRTRSDMALLSQCSDDNITLHPKGIFGEGERSRKTTTEESSAVRPASAASLPDD